MTSSKPWPFEFLQVNMCFLRGPLRWLTEQKNPKFSPSLQNAQSATTNLGVIRWLNLHNKLALTKFERCQQYTIIDNSYSDFNDCILRVFDNWRHAWERLDLKKMAEDFTAIEREREDSAQMQTKSATEIQNILLSECNFLLRSIWKKTIVHNILKLHWNRKMFWRKSTIQREI